MKKGILFVACLVLGCGAQTEATLSRARKAALVKVLLDSLLRGDGYKDSNISWQAMGDSNPTIITVSTDSVTIVIDISDSFNTIYNQWASCTDCIDEDMVNETEVSYDSSSDSSYDDYSWDRQNDVQKVYYVIIPAR
jgi:hypothetical protein